MKSTAKPENTTGATRILDAEMIRRALRRIAHEIVERNQDLSTLLLIGIPARGIELARRIGLEIEATGKGMVPTGAVDVSMHRDDLGRRKNLPLVRRSQFPVPLDGRTVVIVDDVLFTGRTCRAAMDALRDFGRPAAIQLAVLIDRGHRELPIRADFVGKNLPTAASERVRVRLADTDQEPDGVWLLQPEKQ
jgi:pyrimidine operon attenuation protein/uracil phosphoribosyltransferase